ncbi:MAG TPA: UpxY family transcription antiterminator [Flavitalea sp.]|nr:UpxY family transcription antiterminator [Flavitalea sp.]
MNMEKENWYALYTKPRWEKKVADLLSKRKIVNYCPLNKVQKQWSDRKKIVLEPLFRSYVFVRISESRQPEIRQIDGVVNFVYWLGKPAVIHDNEIDVIKRFLHDYENVQLEKAEVNLNDTVRVTHGPLLYMEGNVVEVKHKTVKVLLPSLGFTLVAEIDKSHIEKVKLVRQFNLSSNDNIKLSN